MLKRCLTSCLLLAAGACALDEAPEYATEESNLIIPPISLPCPTLDEVVADMTAKGIAIGALVTPEQSFFDGTRYREYEHAVVARASGGCGVGLSGPLFERWREEGSLKPTTIYYPVTLVLYNRLGPPRSTSTFTIPRAGELARFDNARIYWTASSGTALVRNQHLAEFVRQGSHQGWLGVPTSDSYDFNNGWGESSITHFDNGAIFADRYVTDETTPRTVALSSAWRDKWLAKGGPQRPPFSWPSGSAVWWADGTTTLQFETGGEMIHNARTGLFALHGPVLARWTEWGHVHSFLGLPTSDTGVTKAGTLFTHFENGSLYDHPVYDIYWVDVPMRSKWESLGWEWGWLGYPVGWPSDSTAGGRFQPFDGGYMYTHAGMTFPIPYADGMQQGFWNAGAEFRVGYPIGDVVACGGSQNGHYQNFDNGVITSNYNGTSTPYTTYFAGKRGDCARMNGWACSATEYHVCYPDDFGGDFDWIVQACDASEAIAEKSSSVPNPSLLHIGPCRGPGSGTTTPGTGSTCDEAGETCCGESCMGNLECDKTRNLCYTPCDIAGGCGDGDTDVPGPEIDF